MAVCRKERERNITAAIEKLTGSPFSPTSDGPGTPGKIAMLSKRFDLGLDLFHPDDQPGDDSGDLTSKVAQLMGEPVEDDLFD